MKKIENKDYFQVNVVNWFKVNGRNFPWRKNNTPYNVLISEVLLQRTKAKQVKPIYKRLIEKFPENDDLYQANIGEIKKIIEPLGLIKRASYLKSISKEIRENYDNTIPNEKESLLKLKGIGQYTANAILVFAFGKKIAVVDSNVIRILKRVYQINHNHHKPNKKITKMADKLLNEENPRYYNYGLLDLSAKICLPRTTPKCEMCPLKKICNYYSTNYL